jgi:phosphoribosylamine--glycine ligase
MMKILLVGNGGREHALAWKLSRSRRFGELLVAPGNPGTAEIGRNVPVGAEDIDGLMALARDERVDLVVVGPEVPLAGGLADRLHDKGVACFGPTRAATEIESSKAQAKALMAEVGIPAARSRVFPSSEAALRFLGGEDWSSWRVVKADGLHAGKGVVVAETEAELRTAIVRLGAAERLLLEEPLDGEEISLLAFSDGHRIAVMPPAQDHKRIGDGDRGPNTGGMGAYAPVASAADRVDELAGTVVEPIIAALAARGTPFTGVLFAGLMLTSRGPRVLEYNARWGDPEAQALLPLLDADLIEIMEDCIAGRLRPETVRWRAGAALGVVLAAAGYPGTPRRGDPISLPAVEDGVYLFHAGTALRDGELVTAGGRVLTVVGEGPSLEVARERAYACAGRIHFAGKQMRHDIGWRSLGTASGRG